MNSTHVPNPLLAAGALCALACLAPLGSAQDPVAPPAPAGTPSTAAAQAAPAARPQRDPTLDELGRRNRVDLHSGTPIELVGQQQGDPSLRESTPALLNAKHAPRTVDEEQAYQRALALYGERATFTSALPRAAPATDAPPKPRPPQVSPPSPPPKDTAVPAAKPDGPWPWILAVGIAAVLTSWFLRRQQLASERNQPQTADAQA